MMSASSSQSSGIKKRPVFLNLFKIRFPLTAIVSILHRISGVLLFLFVPAVLGALSYSLQSEAGFLAIKDCCAHPVLAFLFYIGIAAFILHLLAGLRHLCMDMHWGESLPIARRSALLVLFLSVFLILWVGLLGGIWVC